MSYTDVGTVTGDVDKPLQLWAGGVRDNQEDHQSRLQTLRLEGSQLTILGKQSGYRLASTVSDVEILDYSYPLGSRLLMVYATAQGGDTNAGLNASSYGYHIIDVEDELISGTHAAGHDDNNGFISLNRNWENCIDGLSLAEVRHEGPITEMPETKLELWKPDNELRITVNVDLDSVRPWGGIFDTWAGGGSVLIEAWGLRGYDLLENFKDDTKFSSHSNTTLSSNTSWATQGANSLNVAKTDSTTTDNWASFIPTTPYNWSMYDTLEVDTSISESDFADLDYFEVYFMGGGGANTLSYRWPSSELSHGENTLILDSSSFYSLTGTPNFSSIVQARYSAVPNDSSNALSSPSFDNLRGVHDSTVFRVHSFEDYTEFSPSTDATIELDTVNYTQGYSATKIIKGGITEFEAKGNMAFGVSQDLSPYSQISLDVNVSAGDATAISQVSLMIGALASDYLTFTYGSALLEDFDTIAHFTTSADGTIAANTINHTQGSAGVDVIKDGTTSSYAAVIKDFSSHGGDRDWSEHSHVTVEFHIPSTAYTDIDDVYINLTSILGSSQWVINKSSWVSLGDDKYRITIDLSSPTSTAGSGCSLSAIEGMWIRLYVGSIYETFTDVVVDNMRGYNDSVGHELSAGLNTLVFDISSPSSTTGTPDMHSIEGMSVAAIVPLISDTLTGITFDNLEFHII